MLVIEARCADTPTATLLALKGYGALLVDRIAFPSYIPITMGLTCSLLQVQGH